VYYYIWFSATDVLTGVLGSWEAGRVHCVQGVIHFSVIIYLKQMRRWRLGVRNTDSIVTLKFLA